MNRGRNAFTVLGGGGLLLLSLLFLKPEPAPKLSPTPVAAPVSAAKVASVLPKLPMAFEANAGQHPEEVDFLARVGGYTLFLTGEGPVMVFRDVERAGERELREAVGEEPGAAGATEAALRLRLAGATAGAKAEGRAELPGKVSYFRGKDPAKWRSSIPT
jgi:hypothetical protein